MSGEFVFEDVGEFGEALHFALVFVDVLNGDDAARDVSLFVSDWSYAQADPYIFSVLVGTEAFDGAEWAAFHHGIRQWSVF